MIEENIFDKHANDYDSWFIENDKLFDAEVNAIKAVLPNKGKVLEVGCGTGIFSKRLDIKDGIEPSKEMAKFAKNRGISIREGSAEKLIVKKGEYDTIIMITVDCFLKDLKSVFKEFFNVLEKEGILIVAFIDIHTELGQIYEENKNNSVYYASAKFHSSSEMQNYIVDAGFEIIDLKQTIFNLENEFQQVKGGNGEGVFAVIKAIKK